MGQKQSKINGKKSSQATLPVITLDPSESIDQSRRGSTKSQTSERSLSLRSWLGKRGSTSRGETPLNLENGRRSSLNVPVLENYKINSPSSKIEEDDTTLITALDDPTTPTTDDIRTSKFRSNKIDKGLEQDSKKMRRELKILLLGAGESGKSTIVKQMKIIHQNGFTTEELMTFRPTILKNLTDSAKAVAGAVRRFQLIIEDDQVDHAVTLINDFSHPFIDSDICTLDSDFVDAVSKMTSDPVTQTIIDRSSEVYVMDSAAYFFENIDRLSKSDYIPDTMDVLRSRTKTTGIYETRFNMDSNLSIYMFDVGGQRSERKKWIHCFEAVTSILFCVALSEYDQALLEESNQSRMSESMALFDSVINSRWFIRTSIILFLNKVDVFKRKLERIPLQQYFPEYDGGPNITRAAKFLLWKFCQANRQKLIIYPHLTQATDTSNIRLVFAAVKETILLQTLEDIGLC